MISGRLKMLLIKEEEEDDDDNDADEKSVLNSHASATSE